MPSDELFEIDPAPTHGPPLEPVAAQPVQACVAPVPPQKDTVRLRVSFFFDGTGNNRKNANARDDSDASYQASVSNVGLLEQFKLSAFGDGADDHITFYIEGIGTTDGKGDSTLDMADGQGGTGILAKVRKGIEQAVKWIAVRAGSDTLEWVHIDTFGFSRGAAAARHCVHQCIVGGGPLAPNLAQRLAAAGKPPGQVVCKFVGLFDTVASYGLLVHSNDTRELQLDAVRHAAKVVQLAAAEEHRENFRLTNIASAGAKGEEYFLPGVHSDIGGGYNMTETEDLLLFHGGLAHLDALERDRRWLIAAGWFRAEGELIVSKSAVTLHGKRVVRSNHYSRIPLKLMAEFARKEGVHIGQGLERKHALPQGDAAKDLHAADAAIRAMIAAKGGKTPATWFKADPSEDPAWHQRLRHEHLHFSARYNGIGHAPEWSRAVLFGGVRQRVIQVG